MRDRVWRFGLLVIVLLVAVWLRVHDLAAIPSGVHFDEAANGLLAGDIGLRGAKPIFIEAYTGKEVLFFYIAGSLMFVLGQSAFVLRLAAAFTGVVTIAATVWLCRELFPRKRWTAVFAALLLATDFAMLLFGRLGFRAITQPLLQTLTVAAFLYGIRTGRWRGFAAGGLFLGLAGYTYLAARLFPAVVVIMLVLWLGRKMRARQVALFFGIGGVVIAPLLWFFWQHPEAFWVRIEQVSGEAITVGTYANSYLKSLAMLVWRGDPYWRFNLPFRPLLTPLLALISLFGLWMMRRKWRPLLLIVTAVLLMLLPTALAIGEITPSNLRAIGIFPFVLLPAAYALGSWFDPRPTPLPHTKTSVVSAVCALLLLLLLTLYASDSYFHQWATRDDVFYETDADLQATAAYLDQYDGVPSIFVAAKHYQHPSLAFTTSQYDKINWLVDAEAFVLPTAYPALYLFPHSAPAPAWLRDRLPDPAVENRSFAAYRLDAPLLWEQDEAAAYQFGDVVDLTGYTVLQPTPEQLHVQLQWQVKKATAQAFVPFVHLEAADGYRWAQNDSIGYLAEQWRPGDTLIYQMMLDIPAGMPTGDYRLQVGLFDGTERLALQDTAGRFAGTTAILPVSLIGNPQPSAQTPANVIDQMMSPGVRLLGFDRLPTIGETGTTLPFRLWWQLDVPAAVSAKLNWVSAVGDVTAWDEQLLTGNQFMLGRVTALLPLDLPSGDYTLQLQTDETTLTLGQVTITATQRLFEKPLYATETNALFGEHIRLAGYTLDDTTFDLTLVWQAMGSVTADYTVFVHVLNPDGTCCAWQLDAQPVQNSYPTTRWLPAEYVADKWQIAADKLPTGDYLVEIGLYDAQTGNRLIVQNGGEGAADFLYLSPLKIR